MNPIRAAVLTVSDRRWRGEAADEAGPALVAMLRHHLGAEVVATACVPDEAARISEVFLNWAKSESHIDLILSTGGTGLGSRDVTPEAASSVIVRPHPGLMELVRMRCSRTRGSSEPRTPAKGWFSERAYLSRGVAGAIGRTLIITLPGSTRGAGESLEALLGILPHAIETLRDQADHQQSARARQALPNFDPSGE